MSTHAFLPCQKLMIDWLELMKNFTPYDSGVSKEAWDIEHKRLKQQTQQLLANTSEYPDSFLAQVISLQLLVDEWEGEQQ